jgi:hypothetical protein
MLILVGKFSFNWITQTRHKHPFRGFGRVHDASSNDSVSYLSPSKNKLKHNREYTITE